MLNKSLKEEATTSAHLHEQAAPQIVQGIFSIALNSGGGREHLRTWLPVQDSQFSLYPGLINYAAADEYY